MTPVTRMRKVSYDDADGDFDDEDADCELR